MASFIYPSDKGKNSETQTITLLWWDAVRGSVRLGRTGVYKSYVSNAVIIAKGNVFEGIEAKW